MSARQKLDVMRVAVTVGAIVYDFFFMGQKETYTELGLSGAECGVAEPDATELRAGLPKVTVSALLKSGKVVRMRASGTSGTGRKVSRSLLVAADKIQAALTAVNDTSPPTVDGAILRLIQPTRRRLK